MTGMADRFGPQSIRPLTELPRADSELMRLISALCDGVASPADCDRLEQLLEIPSAMAVYNAVIDIEAALRWSMRPQRIRVELLAYPPIETIDSSAAAGSQGSAWIVTRDGCVAAMAALYGAMMRTIGWLDDRTLLVPLVLLALVVGGAGAFMTVVGRPPVSPLRQRVAEITALQGVTWAGSQRAFTIGDSLKNGTTLNVAAGLVQVIHGSGARVVIEGPASYRVADGSAGQLDRGRLTATLERPASPFAIRTPTAVITDHGTQFGVDVNSKGETEVRVFEGAVEVASAMAVGMAQPLRLAAGEIGEVDQSGWIGLVSGPVPKSFVVSLPRESNQDGDNQLPFDWESSQVHTLIRDSFAGTGKLAGTPPIARDGIGDASWIASPDGWRLDESTMRLWGTGPGAAFLPFQPEPGKIYRLSVEMDVLSGGSGWAAIGFAKDATTNRPVLGHGWMLQRQHTRLTTHHTAMMPNVAYGGPNESGRVIGGDECTGHRVRTIFLDTTQPRYRVWFLVDDSPVGECQLDTCASDIQFVALSVFADTKATFHSFSLLSFIPSH